jgi:molybdopterin-guanine dinucleotide biosynthesis protein A
VLSSVVVLAGGRSRRLGHDKLVARLGDGTVLDHLLDALGRVLAGVPILCVGPPRDTQRQVTWLIEDPPGGGPVAGIARALDHLDETDQIDQADDGWLAVVAGDQPFAAEALAGLTREALGAGSDVDAVLARDGERTQPLLAVYRVGALRRAIGADAANRSVRSVVRELRARELVVPRGSALDVDTAADLEAARHVATTALSD